MVDRTKRQTIGNFTRSAVLLPLDMGCLQRDRSIVVAHIEAANGAFVVVGSKNLLAEKGIALLAKQLEFKS